jgi:hypothetical protein
VRRSSSALLLVVLLAGCTIWKKEKRASELKGSIEATVTKVDRTKLGVGAIGGGHVGILVPEVEGKSSCELKVTKPKALTLRVPEPCDAGYQLESDAEGRRLAYAPPSGEWSIVHFAKSGRSFDGHAHPPAGPLDWSKVPSLSDELVPLFRSAMSNEVGVSFKPAGNLLLDEIAEAGDTALARVLEAASVAATPTEHDTLGYTKKPLYARALDRLKEESRRELLATLGKRLATLAEDADAASFRAALYGDVDALTDGLDAAVKTRDPRTWGPDIQYVAALLLARRPRPDVACAILERFAEPGSLELRRHDVRVALATLGMSNNACAAIDARLGGAWCTDKSFFCTDHVCTADEARAKIASFFKLPLPDARRLDLDGADARAAALLARKLDPVRKKQLERHFYQRETKAEMCYAVEAGVTCKPYEVDLTSDMMCSKDATGSDAQVTVHFDDAKKKLWFTRN